MEEEPELLVKGESDFHIKSHTKIITVTQIFLKSCAFTCYNHKSDDRLFGKWNKDYYLNSKAQLPNIHMLFVLQLCQFNNFPL